MTPEIQKIYDRLKAKMDAQKVLIKANPFPYLDRLSQENARLSYELEQLRLSAYPDTPETIFSAANAGVPEMKPLDLVQVTREDRDCLVRLRHLLERSILDSKEPS